MPSFGLTVRLFLILLLVGLIYHPALGNRYAFDDVEIVQKNRLLSVGAGLSEIFRSTYWDKEEFPDRGLYRPLTVATFRLGRVGSNSYATFHHGLNIVLHALVGILVFFFFRAFRAGSNLALFFTFFYLAHPIHTEVVSGLVGRADLLAALFAFLALLIGFSGKIQGVGRRVLLAGLFLLSLLSKESAATLFVLVPLSGWIAAKGADKEKLLLDTIPLLAVLFLYLVIRYQVLGVVGVAEGGQDVPGETFFTQKWGALAYLSFYIQKLFIPIPLLPDYGSGLFNIGSLESHVRAGISLTALVVVLLAATHLLNPKRTWSLTWGGMILFLMAIAPVSNLIFPIGTPFAERFLYFPLPFLILVLLNRVVCLGRENGFEIRPSTMFVGIIVIGILGGLSWARSSEWKDNGTLFAAGVRDTPKNFHLRLCLATHLMEMKQIVEAKRHFGIAIRLNPLDAAPFIGLGKVAFDIEDYRQAVEYYQEALQRSAEEKKYRVHYNLFHAYARLDQRKRARLHLEKCLELKPDFSKAIAWRNRLR